MKTDHGERKIIFGSREIPYQLHTMPRKRLRIVVRPDLSVRVEAPEGCREEHISEAVKSKGRWIIRQLDEIAAFHPLPQPYRYISGETLVYLGRQYRLRVVQGVPTPAKLRGRFLCVSVVGKEDTAAVRTGVVSWYRRRADDVFSRSIKRCIKIAERHGASKPALTIRKMRTRWGSCSASGRMMLNLHLVQVPVHCIDYVVMHEFCHTVEHNHSRDFYRLMTRCMPDWERRKTLLNKFSVVPL